MARAGFFEVIHSTVHSCLWIAAYDPEPSPEGLRAGFLNLRQQLLRPVVSEAGGVVEAHRGAAALIAAAPTEDAALSRVFGAWRAPARQIPSLAVLESRNPSRVA